MILNVISDTHTYHNDIDTGKSDFLVHCGDYSSSRYSARKDFFNFIDWYKDRDSKYKILISGNHDFETYKNLNSARKELEKRDIIYLENESITIEGYKFYGTPYTQIFFDWAYMLNEKKLKMNFDLIENDTDILITHGPPYSILDKNLQNKKCGSKELLEAIKKISARLILFGHIHESAGSLERYNKLFVNASSLLSSLDYRSIDLNNYELIV